MIKEEKLNLVSTRRNLLQLVHLIGEELNKIYMPDKFKKPLIRAINATEHLAIMATEEDYKKRKKEIAQLAYEVGGVGFWADIMERKCKVGGDDPSEVE